MQLKFNNSHDELFILVNLRLDVRIPPLDPLVERRPLRMHRQVIPHFVYMIEKAGYALHGITHHHESSLNPFVEVDQYTITLRIVSFDSDDLRATAVVVPIVSRP